MHYKSNNILTKTKVVFLAKRYTPHIGGVETHVAHVSEQLLKQNYDIIVITEQHHASLSERELIHNVLVLRIPLPYLSSKLKVWLWMLRHATIFMRANIIHAHDVGWWYLPFRIILWWKPFFTTFHGYEGSFEPKVNAILSRKFIEWCSQKTMCIGAWMTQWYQEKPDVISYGAASCAPSPLPKNTSAVFIGRLSDDTGVLSYIDAVMKLQGKITLDIYGDGPLLSQIQRMIMQSSYIHYKGVTRHPEEALRTHRFAFVSRYLGMIEAQQVGRLVFAQWDTNIKKSYLDMYPNAKNMIIFHTPQQLVEELQYIQSHSMFERTCVQNAQLWATSQTWEHVAQIYKELWQP